MTDSSDLVAQVMSALDTAGEIESWVQTAMVANDDTERLTAACREVAKQLLSAAPPRTADWEHLLVAFAAHSSKSKLDVDVEASRTVIEQLSEMVSSGALEGMSTERVATFASSMTVALAAQRKLRQQIEEAVGLIVDNFPNAVQDMAERSQDIWHRRGQMSGAGGLFVWDLRNHEWRLGNDFRPLRPGV